jgi:hypothetical protein
MHLRTLGTQGLRTSALGLGTMGMTMAYGTAQNDGVTSVATIRRAFELGVTLALHEDGMPATPLRCGWRGCHPSAERRDRSPGRPLPMLMIEPRPRSAMPGANAATR